MAKTSIETGDNLTKKVWEEKVFRESQKMAYFNRFMGESMDSIVCVKKQLTKSRGDNITFGLIKRLTGAGVTGTQILEGNEERLNWADDSVTLELYRHGIRDRGKLDRQRAMFEISKESEQRLKVWAAEKIDQLCFDELTGTGTSSNTPTKVFYPDSSAVFQGDTAANAIAGLDASNSKITLNFISALRSWASTGGDRQYEPLRPINVDGRKVYVLLVHPDVAYDLKVSSAWQQAQREAQNRGDKNPLFTGAIGMWDNVVIHEHENVPTLTDGGGGGNVAYAKCSLLGAQSLIWAWGAKEEVTQETFDYKNEIGYGWGMIAKCKRPQFDSKDWGSLGVYLARTNISAE
jgi:N4-gp56 family major capsid protein